MNKIQNHPKELFNTNLLTYGINDKEEVLLEEVAKKIKISDPQQSTAKEISVFKTNNWTDIIAVPFFFGVVNFEKLNKEERDAVIGYYEQREGPHPQGPWEDHLQIYALNCPILQKDLPRCFTKGDSIFDNKEALRLKMLSAIKDLQGIGRSSTNAIRIYRILQMYKILKETGSISKNMLDSLIYPDTTSNSMFYRDMSIIKQIEVDNINYDKVARCYRLKRDSDRLIR